MQRAADEIVVGARVFGEVVLGEWRRVRGSLDGGDLSLGIGGGGDDEWVVDVAGDSMGVGQRAFGESLCLPVERVLQDGVQVEIGSGTEDFGEGSVEGCLVGSSRWGRVCPSSATPGR